MLESRRRCHQSSLNLSNLSTALLLKDLWTRVPHTARLPQEPGTGECQDFSKHSWQPSLREEKMLEVRKWLQGKDVKEVVRGPGQRQRGGGVRRCQQGKVPGLKSKFWVMAVLEKRSCSELHVDESVAKPTRTFMRATFTLYLLRESPSPRTTYCSIFTRVNILNV